MADDGAAEAEIGVELFQIQHCWTGAVLFEAELSAEVSRQPLGSKLGAAIKLALKARANLAGANLADANLAGANLADANLADANLADANLVGANLARAYLVDANLVGANLARAYLVDANLVGANLARANLADAYLVGANLARANLADAYLVGANLARAKDVIGGGQPNGYWTFGYRKKETGAIRVKVGCHDKSIAEAREYWSPSHPHWSDRQEIPAALDMIEVVARLRGWTTAPVEGAAR